MGEVPTAASDKPASLRYAWAVVAMLWCISFFNYADRQAVNSVFPLIGAEMGLTNVEKGLLGSSFAWVYGLCSPLAGGIVDRVRRKSAILVGLHVWSAICLATGLSRRLWHLVFFRAAEGLGESCYYPASTSMLSDYHGQATRSRALGLHQTSVYVGTVAGGWFAGEIGERFGWRWSFYVFGGLGIVLGFVLQRFLREPPRGGAEAPAATPAAAPPPATATGARGALRVLLETPTVALLMAAFLSANFVAVVLLTWMPEFLHVRHGLSVAKAGLVATIFVQSASLVGAILGGWLADWCRARTPSGRVLVQLVGVFGGAPFVFLCGQADSVVALALILTVWGLCKGLYDANIFAAVFDVVPPASRGTVAGCMNLVGWLGGGAGGVLIGYLADQHGLGWAISATSLSYLLSGTFLLVAAIGFVRRDVSRVGP